METKLQLIEELKQQLESLENDTKLNVEEERQEAEWKEQMIKYLKFNNVDDENKFYEKIKVNKQYLKKLYIKCYKQDKNLQKKKNKYTGLMRQFTSNGLDKKYDIENYDGGYVECNKLKQLYLDPIYKLNSFEDYFTHYSSDLIKDISRQHRSRWKTRLAEMNSFDPELQLFWLATKLDKENWEYYIKNMKIDNIISDSIEDPYFKLNDDKYSISNYRYHN